MGSRLRIWGFTALVVACGLAGLWAFSPRVAAPGLDQVSATLRSGTLQFETGTRLLSRQVRDVAAVASRDPALVKALAAFEAARAARAARTPGGPVPVDLAVAANTAVHSAAALLEVEMGRAPLVGFAHDPAVSLRVGDRQLPAGDPLAQLLLGSGAAPRHVRVEQALYAVAVIHTDREITLAFGLPIDPRWTGRLQAATGADLTFVGAKPVSTLSDADAAPVVAAARASGEVVDAGRVGPIPAAPGLPALPVLFLKAPAFRARALSLAGIEGPVAVLSAPVRPALEPVALFQQALLGALLLLAIVGLVLGLVREPLVPSHVPRELAAAADRIARGDFDTRVPRMSGTFGTLASALSRAAESARMARIAQGAIHAPPVPAPAQFPAPAASPREQMLPAPTLDVPLHAVPPDENTDARRLGEFIGASGLAPPATPTPTPLDGRLGGSPLAAAAVQAAQAARAGHPRTTMPIGTDGRVTPAVGRATPSSGRAVPPGRSTPPPTEEDREATWRPVYDEFLRVRTEQGEAVEGVTWDRFREKLRKNRELLVQKYACRTVRFQVYVKDGKAALRATPVR
jgi:HAMP domain-containing protein